MMINWFARSHQPIRSDRVCDTMVNTGRPRLHCLRCCCTTCLRAFQCRCWITSQTPSVYSTCWTLLKTHLFSNFILFSETPSLVTLYTIQCRSSDYNDLRISYKFAVYVTVYIDWHYVTLLMTEGIFDDDDNHWWWWLKLFENHDSHVHCLLNGSFSNLD